MIHDFSEENFLVQNTDYYYEKIKSISKNSLNFIWLGIQDYAPVLDLQKRIHKGNVDQEINDVVLFLEHNHVYTLGKNANRNHVLPSGSQVLDVVKVDRGGDVTYHGPGQLVGYPILNLKRYNKSISWYLDFIQSSIVSMLDSYNVKASNKESPFVGVWVGEEKIAAIGVRLSRWVSMHGFAININTNLDYYNGIIPCGIFELGVTSLKEIINKDVDVELVASKMSNIIASSLEEVFIC